MIRMWAGNQRKGGVGELWSNKNTKFRRKAGWAVTSNVFACKTFIRRLEYTHMWVGVVETFGRDKKK